MKEGRNKQTRGDEKKKGKHFRFNTRISETLSGFDVSWTLTDGRGRRCLFLFAQHEE
jgi:hypothetical protein